MPTFSLVPELTFRRSLIYPPADRSSSPTAATSAFVVRTQRRCVGIEIYASSEYESLFGKGKGSLVNPLRAGTKGFWKFWIFDASREVEGATCPVPMETGARSFSKANARRGERLRFRRRSCVSRGRLVLLPTLGHTSHPPRATGSRRRAPCRLHGSRSEEHT